MLDLATLSQGFQRIRECFVSARHILEHAFGAGMGRVYFPLRVEFLKHQK